MAESQSADTPCYVHYGGMWKVRENGQAYYDGGEVDVIFVNMEMTFEEFIGLASNVLQIDASGKIFRYSSGLEKTLIRMFNQRGVQSMLRLNKKEAYVYITDLEEYVPRVSTRDSNIIDNEKDKAIAHLTTRIDRGKTEMMDIITRDDDAICGNVLSQSQSHASAEITMPMSGQIITLEEGQIFDSPDQFKQAVACLALSNKFEVRYLDNSRSYYRLRCKVEGCGWKLTAGCEGKCDLVRVKRFINIHTHTALDIANYKPTVRSKYIGQMIKGKIMQSPQYLPRQIGKDFEESFAMQMTYKQAWRAKEWAKTSIMGTPRDNYKYLPWMCQRLRDSIPGSHVALSVSDEGRFEQLFVAYGCSIAGFKNGCRPLLFIDSCHITAYYGGVLMCATALEGNNGLYPLAYCFASAENDDNWLWFMQELKVIIPNRDVVLMTDRNPSLLSAISQIFGSDCNAWCLRHLKENFSSFVRKNGLKTKAKDTALRILTNMAYARDETKFQIQLTLMYNLKQELGKWVEENEPKHWANAFFPKKRWDCMYTNPAESLNAWMVSLRDLNIFQFMKDHVLKVTEFLYRKKLALQKSTRRVGPKIEEKIRESQMKSQGLTHRAADQGKYTVFNDHYQRQYVDLLSQTCTCLEWQQSGIPCPHAVVVAGPAGLNVYDLVDWHFKKEAQERVYEFLMSPVPTHDEPDLRNICGQSSRIDMDCEGPPPASLTLPPVTKRRPGRPKKKRIESQFQERRVIHCSRCHSEGHNRSTCVAALSE